MDLSRKEVVELLNLFRRTSSEKEEGLAKSFCAQAIHLPSYKEEDFNAARRRLIGDIGRQISILELLMKRNIGRRDQINSILSLSPQEMEKFLRRLMESMKSKSFRDKEFCLRSEKNYEDLRQKAERFLSTMNIMRRMGNRSNYKIPSELKERLRDFLTAEYRIETVERVCQRMKDMLLSQLGRIDSIKSLGELIGYMEENGIEQLKDVPEEERKFVEENAEVCKSLLASIRKEESIGPSFKLVINRCFNRTMIIRRISESVKASENSETPDGLLG